MSEENKIKILLVEDEVLIAMDEKMKLEDYGYTVITANDGEKAIRIFKEDHDIGLILMDIELGRSPNGPETTSLILKEREIPVIFLSSHKEPEIVRKTEKITSYGYIVKDSDIVVLDASIKMALKLFEAKKALTLRESYLSAIIENQPGMLWLKDTESRFLAVNKNTSDFYGLDDPGQLIGKSDFDICPPELAQKYRADDLKVINTKISYRIEEPIYSKEQIAGGENTGWFETYKTPIFGKNGDVIGTTGYAFDITERKKAENELIKREENSRKFFEEHSSVQLIIDPENGNIIDANTAASKYYGWSREDLKTMNINEINMLSRLETQDEMKKAKKRLKTHFEFKHRISDGSVRDVDVYSNTIILSGKVYLHSIIFDITEHRKEEERFKSVLDNSRDVIYRLNLQTGSYEYISPSAEAVVGYSPDELKAMDPETALTMIHPDDLNIFLEGAENGYLEYRQRTKKGDYRWLSNHTIVTNDDSGRPLYRDGNIRDITGQKQSEEKIRKLLEEKDLILKEVHHRLKNNMNTINSLLIIQAGTLKDSPAIEALNDASRRVRSMMFLYDKLYLASSGDNISVKEYLSSLVDEIVANFPNSPSVKIGKKIDDFTLNVKTAQTLGVIINELLTNIMKYAFTGRTEGLIKVSALIKDNLVSVTVEDNGSGLPVSVDFENSTGFGLKLIGMMVKQINGAIRIERVNGTRIILEFQTLTIL